MSDIEEKFSFCSLSGLYAKTMGGSKLSCQNFRKYILKYPGVGGPPIQNIQNTLDLTCAQKSHCLSLLHTCGV